MHRACMHRAWQPLHLQGFATAAFTPPATNPPSLVPEAPLHHSAINAKILAAAGPTELNWVRKGIRFYMPCTAAALLCRLVDFQDQLIASPDQDLISEAVRQADLNLHGMQPDELLSTLWALSKLQPLLQAKAAVAPQHWALVQGLPRRIADILAFRKGAALALANRESLGESVNVDPTYHHLCYEDLGALQLFRSSLNPPASPTQIDFSPH
jgi:hypothetical protein